MRIDAFDINGEHLGFSVKSIGNGLIALPDSAPETAVSFTGQNLQELTDNLRSAGWCRQHLVRKGALVIDEWLDFPECL